MERHTRYLTTRDGVFRVLVPGERPKISSADRYPSTAFALDTLYEYLNEGRNYITFARGLDRLCPPHGIAELINLEVFCREAIDDKVILDSGGASIDPVSFIATRI
ncbi:MAG: hypothetical protein QG623_161 [Patescibacteria group bacterium]|nr:hypothetical protein [Patescibacteria group bacterium]